MSKNFVYNFWPKIIHKVLTHSKSPREGIIIWQNELALSVLA
jgi:hypothetical protein